MHWTPKKRGASDLRRYPSEEVLKLTIKKVALEISDIEIQEHVEVGQIIRFQCPDCHYNVRYADGAWWDITCGCGYNWEIITKITAIGKKA